MVCCVEGAVGVGTAVDVRLGRKCCERRACFLVSYMTLARCSGSKRTRSPYRQARTRTARSKVSIYAGLLCCLDISRLARVANQFLGVGAQQCCGID